MPRLPVITARLALRPFTTRDHDDHFDYWHRPEVARYVPWQPGTRAQAMVALERRSTQTHLTAEGDALNLAVVVRDPGRVIGEVMLQWTSKADRQGEIGYAFNPDFHGQGFATEAVEAMLRIGFQDLGLHRIFGRCDLRNEPSARLMARLGMRQEAHLRENEFFKGEWTDELIFAFLDGEWASRADRSRPWRSPR